MSALAATYERSPRISPLENGLHLNAIEFLRRFEAMPDLKKAELIDGVVYMGSPVRTDQHGIPDSIVQGWLFNYAASTPRVRHAINATVRLAADNVPQPDGFLWILGGLSEQQLLDEKGYFVGVPQLIAEIAGSSAALDARSKRGAYQRAGVQEYLLWRTEENAIDWWQLENGQYEPIQITSDGLLKSRVFPGLWLDWQGMLQRDTGRVLAGLRCGIASPEHAEFVR